MALQQDASFSPKVDHVNDSFIVRGGNRLEGAVDIAGAKNSALKLMAVALMAQGRTVLTNCPVIDDIQYMADVLRSLGCVVDVDADTVTIDCPKDLSHMAVGEVMQKFRASICVLGPLLARQGQAQVSLPGGDAIGGRPLNMHQAGLMALGAEVNVKHGVLHAVAQKLVGTEVKLAFPSVGATENTVTAAVLASGRTVLHNAAREPEIVDICSMLSAMGASIQGVGTSTITIDGVSELKPVEHRVVGDRIVAGTWAAAAMITRGCITVRGIDPMNLHVPLEKFAQSGAEIERGADHFTVNQPTRPTALKVSTLPFPGFPTDLQPMAIAIASLAEGHSVVTENVFESRFAFVTEMIRMGANASVSGHCAELVGQEKLSSTTVNSSDIRAGAGLVLAALWAEGDTEVKDVYHIDRGYHGFENTLAELGGDIQRISRP